jgi:hypothetical protein
LKEATVSFETKIVLKPKKKKNCSGAKKKKIVLELSVRSRTPHSLIRGFCSSSPHLQPVGFCKNGKSTITDLFLSTDTTGHSAAEDETNWDKKV